jgi:hypothetical protein
LEVAVSTEPTLEPGEHRQTAVALFNRTWELLDKDSRSVAENAEMLTAVFASRYHWRQVGDAKNFSVSDWQVSRVAAVLGYPDLADEYGHRSLEVAATANLRPFYIGYAHEALARAARLAGDRAAVAKHLAAAYEMLELVDDAGERDLLAPDLADLDSHS